MARGIEVTIEGKKEVKKKIIAVERKPYCKENLFLSKEQFMAKEREIEERKAKLKAYEEELKQAPKVTPVVIAKEEIKDDVKEEIKQRGRPKKIE